MNATMIEPHCLIGANGSGDSFRSHFGNPRKWFRRNPHVLPNSKIREGIGRYSPIQRALENQTKSVRAGLETTTRDGLKRTAKPCTPVQFLSWPPSISSTSCIDYLTGRE